MKFKKLTLRPIVWVGMGIVFLLFAIFGAVQGTKVEAASEIAEVNAVIDAFQKSYSSKDIAGVRDLFYAEAVIAWDFDQGRTTQVVSAREWLQFSEDKVFTRAKPISDILTNRDITVHRNIAYAVYDYTYTDDSEKHQGIDVITLLKMHGRWRILSLQWTGDKVAS